jgi:hypothetical protein
LSNVRPQALATPDNEPGLPVFSDAQTECGRRVIVVGAARFEPQHNNVGHVQLWHFFAPILLRNLVD